MCVFFFFFFFWGGGGGTGGMLVVGSGTFGQTLGIFLGCFAATQARHFRFCLFV